MEEFISPNKFDKDLNQHVKKAEHYNFALNAVIENFSEESSFPFLGNAPSNILSSTLPEGERLIAYKFINEFNLVILFTKDSSLSYIKYFKVDKRNPLNKRLEMTSLKDIKQTDITTIYTIVSSGCLKFSEDTNTYIVYKITASTLNLYFVDGKNPDRYIYFDYNQNYSLELNESFKNFEQVSACEIVYNDELNCNSILWYPLISYPSLSLNVVNGGNKEKGVYSYLIAYSTEKGAALSEYKSLTSPIHIFDNTAQSVEINVSDVTTNQRFRYYTVVGIKTIKGMTSYYKVGTYPITQNKVLDSDDDVQNISFDEIFRVFVFYKSSRFIAEQNDILFRASLKEHQRYNLQKLANKLKLKWFKVKLKEGDYSIPRIANQYRTFLSDESYVFGIKFILDNTEETPVFLIPNRTKNSDDILPVMNNDTGNQVVEKWKVYNTASVTYTNGSALYNIDDPQVYQEGEFGYNESIETYPNIPEVWGELCNQPIRLHKFPDVLVSNFHSTSNEFNDKLFIYPLGVKLDDSIDLQILLKEAVTEGLITEEQRLRVKGYKLIRGNRVGNKSIIAKGLLYDVWKYKEDDESCDEGSEYYFPTYPFNDASEDDLLASTKDHYDYEKFELDTLSPTKLTYQNTGRYSFISPDTTFVEPSIGDVLKVESEEYGKSRGIFTESEEQAKQSILTKKHYNVAITLGQIIGSYIQDPTVAKVAGTASSIGQGIGGSLGGSFGLGGIGSALGGLIGGLVGTEMSENNINHVLFRNAVAVAEAEKFLQLFKLSFKPVNLHRQYQAVGKYNNTDNILNNGNKIRTIETSSYLTPNHLAIQEDNNTINFNNWNREKSVYLKLNNNLPTLAKDNSRIKLNTSGTETPIYSDECFNWTITTTSAENNRFTLVGVDCKGVRFFIKEFKNDAYNATFCAKEILVREALGIFGQPLAIQLGDLAITKGDSCGEPELIGYEKGACECSDAERESDISSYYASIKNNVLNQYGTVYDINWLEIHSDMKPLHKCVSDVVKPVNLIPVKLSTENLDPKKHSIVIDIECIEDVDPCSLNVEWNNSNTFTKVCNSDGTTTITVGVNGNGSHMVEFSTNYNSPTPIWNNATQGTNMFSYTVPSEGICHSVWYRVKTCSSVYWGCALSFTGQECTSDEENEENYILGSNPCDVGIQKYRVVNNNNNTIVYVTYEDGINEEWQEKLDPLQTIDICRKSTGSIKYTNPLGVTVGNVSLNAIGECQQCGVYVNSMGGYPYIDSNTKIHTRRFDPKYSHATKTILSNASTYMVGEVREYQIDDGVWTSGLSNVNLSALLGKTVAVSVRFRLNSDPYGFLEKYTAFINVTE